MLVTFFFITAALFLGIALELTVGVIKSSPRNYLHSRWRHSQLLLPHILPRFRALLAVVLLWMGAILLLAEDLLILLIQQLFPSISSDRFALFLSVFLGLIVVTRIFCLPFSLRQVTLLAPVFALAWIILISTRGTVYTYLIAQPVCLLLFFMHAPLRPLMKAGLAIKSAYMVLTVSLCLAGRIPDHWTWLGDVGRLALGFGHYNVLGKALMELIFLYVCFRFVKWRWFDSLLLLAVSAFIWIVPRSRTAFLSIFILLAIIWIGKWFPRLFKFSWMQYLLSASWGLAAVFSLLAGWFYGAVPFLDKLNDLLSDRLFLMHQQMQGPSVQLFGAVSNGTLNWGNAWDPSAWLLDRQAGLYNYNFLDNGYAFCLYMAGPFWLIAFCIGYGLLIRKFLKSGYANWPLAFMLIVMALYTVSEREFASFWIVILLGNLFGGNLSLKSRSPVKRPARK